MIPDPSAEIKRIRHQLGADANFELTRMFAELRRRERTSERTYVKCPPRKPVDDRAMQRGGNDVASGGGATLTAS